MKSSTGLDENIAGALCYLLDIVTGILFLILEKDSDFVRFHAMQSVVVFAGLWIVSWFVSGFTLLSAAFMPFIGVFTGVLVVTLLRILTFAIWLLCMFKAYQGEWFKVPIAGDIAEELVKH